MSWLDNNGLTYLWTKIKNALAEKLDITATAKKTSSIPMGEVDDSSTATSFTATIDGITELRDGVCMWLKNGVVTSASGFTININGLGAKPVYSSLSDASRATTIFSTTYTCLFIYNSERVSGGCWDLVYGIDSNTNYVPTGYCTTGASTVKKAVTINYGYRDDPNYFPCLFRYANTAANATLSISTYATTELPIYVNGQRTSANNTFGAGVILFLFYNNAYWCYNDGRLPIVWNGTVTSAQDVMSELASKSELPTKTSDLTNDSGYLTSHQDISMKADSATTLSGYGITDAYTKSEVDTAILNIPIENADWAENDTTSSAYVENRTHYVERTPLTEVLTYNTEDNDTYYQISYPDEEWAKSLNEGDAYSLTLNRVTYTGNIIKKNSNNIDIYCLGNLALRSIGEDTGEPFLLVFAPSYYNIILFLSEASSSGVNMSLSLSSLIIHKLDSKYLDGKLIQSSYGENSEVFNGIEENNEQPRFYTLLVTGEANATIYDFVYENAFQETSYLLSHISPYAYIPNRETIKIIQINVESYNKETETCSGKIYLNSTLDAENSLNNEELYIKDLAKFASGIYSHAEGYCTVASGRYSHAENRSTSAFGDYSHAEGEGTIASNRYTHAEGMTTIASRDGAHAEGMNTVASGWASHAEGEDNVASGASAHAEGYKTTASADNSHAEGYYTTASGPYSHSEGNYTIAQRKSQHVFGEYNISDIGGTNTNSKGNYIEIVGNGTSDSARSNARTLDWSGNEVLAGKLTVGLAPTNAMDVTTKQYVDNAINSSGSTYQLYATDDNNGTVTIHFGTVS